MWWSPFGTSPTARRDTTEKQPDSQPTTNESSQEPPRAATRALSREEQASADLDEFLKEIQIETGGVGTSSRSLVETNAGPKPIEDSVLYPNDMSCRSSLDYAMFCQSLGGQFVNVYRYGTFRSCSNHWSDFWFCMRTRNWEDVDRRKAVSDHFRKKEAKHRVGKNSEDIWTVRKEGVRDAFQENLEELEEKIAVWKKENPGVEEPWSNKGKIVQEIGSKV